MTAPLRFDVVIQGRRAQLELRLPPLGEVLSLWMAPPLRTPERAAVLTSAEIRRFVAHANGDPLIPDESRAIAADGKARTTYRAVRDRALENAVEGGVVYARCPHCLEWEADLIPLALAVRLRVPFRPVVDLNGGLALPALAEACGRALDGAPPAARLSFALPRARPADSRGVFDSAQALIRLAEWQHRTERLFRDSPEEMEDWEPESPGWRAFMRFAATVSEWPGTGALATVHDLASIPLGDFLFVDNVYYLTHCAPQPIDAPLVVPCARCGGAFHPLAPTPEWSERMTDGSLAD